MTLVSWRGSSTAAAILALAGLVACGGGGSDSSGSAGSGGGGSGGGGSGGSKDAGAVVTYVSDVKAIFAAKCSPCHTTGGANAPSHTMASLYTDVNKASFVCVSPQKKRGECALIRIKDGSMPFGGGCKANPTGAACLTQAQIDKVEAWVAGGLLPGGN